MSDHEALHSHDEKRKKRMKLLAYIAAFAVFQVIVILVFVMVVLKVRTPKLRIGDGVVVGSLTTDASSPSFDLNFVAPIRIKNNNFGPYKYDETVVNFTYAGIQVGQATIPKSTANFMGTKKLDVTVSLSSSSLTSSASSGLSGELNSGVLTLNSQARMQGKAEIMLIFKKKKATDMNCVMEFDTSAKTLKSVQCK